MSPSGKPTKLFNFFSFAIAVGLFLLIALLTCTLSSYIYKIQEKNFEDFLSAQVQIDAKVITRELQYLLEQNHIDQFEQFDHPLNDIQSLFDKAPLLAHMVIKKNHELEIFSRNKPLAEKHIHFIHGHNLAKSNSKYLIIRNPNPSDETIYLYLIPFEALIEHINTRSLTHSSLIAISEFKPLLLDKAFHDRYSATSSISIDSWKGHILLTKDMSLFNRQLRLIRNLTMLIGLISGLIIALVVYLFHSKQSIALKEKQARLQYQAEHDHLTGIANRRKFSSELSFKLNQNTKTSWLVLLDVDDFKDINDQFGHPVGDKVIQIIAKRLIHNLKDQDTVARIGGDEFALILSDIESESALMRLCEKIQQFLSTPIQIKQLTLTTHVSLGAVHLTSDISEANHMQLADKALYTAKNNGKNNIAVHAG